MNSILPQFKNFLTDKEAPELYITGVAGTGKTTSLNELLSYCLEAKIETITTAYTHKACLVLRGKLPKNAPVSTLHSFLKKCPTINDKATKLAQVDGNAIAGISEIVEILFIDEFSMVGEKDYVDIADIQYDIEGELVTKVVYIGDPNQLPPVKDMKAIEPHGKHWIKLTKIYRQAGDNKLIDTLLKLNDFINGEQPVPLQEHETFVRGKDIALEYAKCKTSKVLLAYTNAQVQHLNCIVQGREQPELGDEIYSPTTRKKTTLISINKETLSIKDIRGNLIELNSKYKTLETLHELKEVQFYILIDKDENEEVRAAIFGHENYLEYQRDLANAAIYANKQILTEFNTDAREWSKANWQLPLAKKRAKAWSYYLAFKSNVICIDFVHAMTVHKSQGSTYENVFLDTENMNLCANKDYLLYLKLLYVAISRASHKVYTN